MTNAQFSLHFFLQLAIVLGACRIVGIIARWIGQPQVVGEMLAGVLLGPSLLGAVCPHVQSELFPRETMHVLFVGGQLGVGLYMFLVGSEFNTQHFGQRAKGALFVSLSGVATPFLIASMLTPWMLNVHGLFGETVHVHQATLFLGAAISITAFPMLARIIHERGLANAPFGTLCLSAGAIDDVAAWCVLAFVLASLGGESLIAIKALLGAVVYIVFMLTGGKAVLSYLARIVERSGQLSDSVFGLLLCFLMLGMSFVDAIGIHAIFGGFLFGAMIPRGLMQREMCIRLEKFVSVFLVPMFFTYSGLNTNLNILGSFNLLFICCIILAASILGKGVACWAAARLSGEDNRTAIAVGALMNSRGLIELIIINIGLERGIIDPTLFSMLVVMALVSTAMVAPIFNRIFGVDEKIDVISTRKFIING